VQTTLLWLEALSEAPGKPGGHETGHQATQTMHEIIREIHSKLPYPI